MARLTGHEAYLHRIEVYRERHPGASLKEARGHKFSEGYHPPRVAEKKERPTGGYTENQERRAADKGFASAEEHERFRDRMNEIIEKADVPKENRADVRDTIYQINDILQGLQKETGEAISEGGKPTGALDEARKNNELLNYLLISLYEELGDYYYEIMGLLYGEDW